MLGVSNLFNPQDPWAHYITNALKAKELFVKDVNYIVRDSEAVIVDEFTGRVMPNRRWSDGQHQAIEAKEALQIQAETQTLGDHLPELFPALSSLGRHDRHGKNGRGRIRKDLQTRDHDCSHQPGARSAGLARSGLQNRNCQMAGRRLETAEIHKNGRPVLVGTTSVKSELLSSLLVEQEIPHNLLNAKPENVERESEIVAQAGRAGAVTIATNMAGRVPTSSLVATATTWPA